METRRTFLKKSTMAAAAVSVPAAPGCVTISTIRAKVPMNTGKTENAAVLWYSQTGYTERDGRLLAKTLEKHGTTVTASDLRDFDKSRIGDYDLIVMGSPVFYYDTPSYVKDWIRSLPDLKGTPVASYVTFGGPEGNQHNAACSILEGLSEKQGVPIALNAFRNMSSYPLAWSEENVNDNVWRARHLPDRETYERVRKYAGYIINQVKQGRSDEFTQKLTWREFATFFGLIWWNKQLISNHSIIEDQCIGCGTCVEKCPVDAIDLDHYTVDTTSCVLCFGCINNCPARAVNMEYNGKKVIGYKQFMKLRHVEVMEPDELKT
ncbi:MAG: EFR1 family ferrodoxin [Proteobacteria bacterium]|nr:EFR1 family ferrodoxin [Pseudomonadota bacterium]